MRRIIPMALAGVGGVSLLFSLLQPAGADPSIQTLLKQGADYAYSDGRNGILVCDQEQDGHGVYAKVWYYGGYETVGDGNGADPYDDCGFSDPGLIYKFSVCETVPGDDWCAGPTAP